MEKILIAGDSWGRGEWFGSEENAISHGGLEYFLKFYLDTHQTNQRYNVRNISVPAGSNYDILNNFKAESNLKEYKYVIIFVTDYLRGCRYDLDKITNKSDLIKVYKETEKYFINEFSKLNHDNIILLGGLSKIDTSLIENIPNLKSPIPSIIEFLTPDKKQHEILPLLVTKKLSDNAEYEYLDYLEEQLKRWDDVRHDIYFLFDRQHPDRNAHLLIYRKLADYLKLKV